MRNVILAIALLPAIAWAQYPTPAPVQTQDQAINSTISPTIDVAPVGSGNVTDTKVKTTIVNNESDRPVNSAYAPMVVPGQCQRAVAIAFQFAGFGASAGGTRQLDSCLARELAILMGETKDEELTKKAKVIWNAEFTDWMTARKLKMQPKGVAYVCRSPWEKHCTRVEAVEQEEPGQ